MAPREPAAPLDPRDVTRHGASLRRLARALVGEGSAEELVQEAWVRALERPPRSTASLGGWLRVVARRLALEERRAGRRRHEREERAGARRAVDPPDVVLARIEEQRRVLDLVRELDEPYRSTLYLRYWEDLPPRVIARRTAVPVETVKTRLARGLALLRRRLDAAGGGRRDWVRALLPVAFPRGAGGALAGAATLNPWLGGTLVVKKAVILCAGTILALAALFLGLRTLDATVGRRGPTGGAVPLLAGGSREVVPVPMLPAVEVERVERDAPARPATGGLEVLVRASDGSPAAGVWLEAVCANDPATREERSPARTDDEGRATFGELFAGEVRLDVDRGPHLEAEIVAGVTRTVELTLPAGELVAGIVRRTDGTPVAGAEICVEPVKRLFPLSYAVTTTGADGRFSLADVGAAACIGARAPGCAPSLCYGVRSLPVSDGGERVLEIVLAPDASTGAVVGRVVDPDGEPVPGARVQVGERGGWFSGGLADPAGRRVSWPRPVTVLTDGTGSFAYPGSLPAGKHPAWATARGWPVWSGEVEVPGGGTAELAITLEHPATITGTVVDAAGQPVEGVDVVASEERGGGWHEDQFPPSGAKTDEAGRFRLEWVAPGDRMLVADDDRRPGIGRALGRVTCLGGRTVDVRLVLDLGVTITGRVVGPAGEGLAGWTVSAEPCSNPNIGQTYPRRARSRSDGTFEVANLDERFRYDLRAWPPGEFQMRATVEAAVPGSRDVVIAVESTASASARVHGRVADVSGGVPRDVQLVLWEGEPGIGRVGRHVAFDPRDGRFDHGPLIPGRYTLHASRAGQTLAQGEPFELAEGEVRDLGVLQLRLAGRIELTVTGLSGDELAGLTPGLEREGYGSEDLQLERGRFVSRDLAPGRWTVELGGDGGWFLGQHPVDVPEDGTAALEIEARFAFEVPVTCRLAADADAGEDAWKGLAYEVRETGGAPVWRSDLAGRQVAGELEDGSRRLWGLALPEGRYRILAHTAAGLRASAEVVVEGPARAAPVELELR